MKIILHHVIVTLSKSKLRIYQTKNDKENREIESERRRKTCVENACVTPQSTSFTDHIQ